MIEQKHKWSDKICLLDHLDRAEFSVNPLRWYCSLGNTHFDWTKWHLIEQKLSARSSWSTLKFPYKWTWPDMLLQCKVIERSVWTSMWFNSNLLCDPLLYTFSSHKTSARLKRFWIKETTSNSYPLSTLQSSTNTVNTLDFCHFNLYLNLNTTLKCLVNFPIPLFGNI